MSSTPDEEPQNAPQAASAGDDVLAGRRILIVEDDPFIAMALEDTLLDFGMSVAGIARNLREAERLALVRAQAAAHRDLPRPAAAGRAIGMPEPSHRRAAASGAETISGED